MNILLLHQNLQVQRNCTQIHSDLDTKKYSVRSTKPSRSKETAHKQWPGHKKYFLCSTKCPVDREKLGTVTWTPMNILLLHQSIQVQRNCAQILSWSHGCLFFSLRFTPNILQVQRKCAQTCTGLASEQNMWVPPNAPLWNVLPAQLSRVLFFLKIDLQKWVPQKHE